MFFLDATQSLFERDATEERRRGAFVPVLHLRGVRDEAEASGHQQMPLPPRRLPVTGEARGEERFREQHERRDQAQLHHRRTAQLHAVVLHGGERIQRYADAAEHDERAMRFVYVERLVERRQFEQRHDRPDEHGGGYGGDEQPAQPQHDISRPPGQIE